MDRSHDTPVSGRRHAPARAEMTVHDTASLAAWRALLTRRLLRQQLPVARFASPMLSIDVNEKLSMSAEEHRRGCSCALSGFLMSAAVVVMCSRLLLAGGPFFTAARLLELAAAAILGVLCGKLAGAIWFRWRLLRLAAAARHLIGVG